MTKIDSLVVFDNDAYNPVKVSGVHYSMSISPDAN